MRTPAKPTGDWERIEAQYRTGVMSLREIAALHNLSEGAIRKRAKRDEWTRDLAAKVQAKAEELVRREEVRSKVRSEGGAYSEKEAVAIGAVVVAEIKLAHKSGIARMRKLCETMLTELEAESGDPELFRELGEFLRSENESATDKRNEVYRRAISNASRIDSMKKLAETLKTLISLEREAHGMASAPQEINLNTKVSKAHDLSDEDLLAIAAGGGPRAADQAPGEE